MARKDTFPERENYVILNRSRRDRIFSMWLAYVLRVVGQHCLDAVKGVWLHRLNLPSVIYLRVFDASIIASDSG